MFIKKIDILKLQIAINKSYSFKKNHLDLKKKIDK